MGRKEIGILGTQPIPNPNDHKVLQNTLLEKLDPKNPHTHTVCEETVN
jgi:hypothetical protein